MHDILHFTYNLTMTMTVVPVSEVFETQPFWFLTQNLQWLPPCKGRKCVAGVAKRVFHDVHFLHFHTAHGIPDHSGIYLIVINVPWRFSEILESHLTLNSYICIISSIAPSSCNQSHKYLHSESFRCTFLPACQSLTKCLWVTIGNPYSGHC